MKILRTINKYREGDTAAFIEGEICDYVIKYRQLNRYIILVFVGL
jgi:hypothetical protein